jgi:hypothetical protein
VYLTKLRLADFVYRSSEHDASEEYKCSRRQREPILHNCPDLHIVTSFANHEFPQYPRIAADSLRLLQLPELAGVGSL